MKQEDHKISPNSICAACGMPLDYPPIQLPVTKPVPISVQDGERPQPGFYRAGYKNFCIACVLGREGHAVAWNIQEGNFSPDSVWVVRNGTHVIVETGEADAEAGGSSVQLLHKDQPSERVFGDPGGGEVIPAMSEMPAPGGSEPDEAEGTGDAGVGEVTQPG